MEQSVQSVVAHTVVLLTYACLCICYQWKNVTRPMDILTVVPNRSVLIGCLNNAKEGPSFESTA